jgi:hypothetical protein
MADEFAVISVEEMREIQNKDKEDKLDHEWAQRISTVPVGAGWKMIRPDEEQQRNFKRRINAAALASGRTLDWYPQETNLPPNVEPKTYVVRVKAHDKTKTYAGPNANGVATAQNSQNGTSEPQQPAGEEPSTPSTSEEATTAQQRSRGR